MTNLSALSLQPGDILDPLNNGDALPIGTLAETMPHMANLWVKTARGCWYAIYRHTATRAEIRKALRDRKLTASPMFGNERDRIRILSVPRPDYGQLPSVEEYREWRKAHPPMNDEEA